MLFTILMGGQAQQSITATVPYQGELASGSYQTFRGCQNISGFSFSNLRSPLIFVEGFDPNDEYDINDIYYGVIGFSPNTLGGRLCAEGFDVIVLNFDDGGDYIQRNAMLLVELINQINANKPNDEELVVAGFSMGGLVARYALTYMEENNINHETRLYISYDSPHKGAHVPAGIQALALTFKSSVYQQIFPNLGDVFKLYDSPAAKQMLTYRLTSATQDHLELPKNSYSLNFYSELEGLNSCNGFPTQSRNVAISLGSWNGIGQRSNIDANNDGIMDLQHSGFPMIYINVPKNNSTSDNLAIWELNSCETVALASFQAFISTSWSNNYPYFNERYNYLNLGNWYHATYYYRNTGGPFNIVFPGGAWDRLWYYEDYQPLDFAPGAFTSAYEQVVDAMSTEIDCHHAFANNSTFIPTVSALAFDTDNYFYDIAADADKLDKTPFDNIIGITGDNTSHVEGQASNPLIVNWLMDEITNNYGGTCAKGSKLLTGEIVNGESVEEEGISTIFTENYVVNNGGGAELLAGQTISFLPGTHIQQGASASGRIQPCSQKGCFWEPSSENNLKHAVGSKGINLEDLNIIGTDNIIEETKLEKESHLLKVYPNPTSGVVFIETLSSGELYIYNSSGQLINKKEIEGELSTIGISEQSSGIYFFKFISENGGISINKITLVE